MLVRMLYQCLQMFLYLFVNMVVLTNLKFCFKLLTEEQPQRNILRSGFHSPRAFLALHSVVQRRGTAGIHLKSSAYQGFWVARTQTQPSKWISHLYLNKTTHTPPPPRPLFKFEYYCKMWYDIVNQPLWRMWET